MVQGRLWMALTFAMGTGCVTAPDWVEGCGGCGADELCDGATCSPIPDECSAALSGGCDLTLLDDACEQTLCGVDEGASYEFSAECWEEDGKVLRFASCSVY